MSETFESHIEELIARVKTIGQHMGHDVEGWFKKPEKAEEDPVPVPGPLEHYGASPAPVTEEPVEENNVG